MTRRSLDGLSGGIPTTISNMGILLSHPGADGPRAIAGNPSAGTLTTAQNSKQRDRFILVHDSLPTLPVRAPPKRCSLLASHVEVLGWSDIPLGRVRCLPPDVGLSQFICTNPYEDPPSMWPDGKKPSGSTQPKTCTIWTFLCAIRSPLGIARGMVPGMSARSVSNSIITLTVLVKPPLRDCRRCVFWRTKDSFLFRNVDWRAKLIWARGVFVDWISSGGLVDSFS